MSLMHSIARRYEIFCRNKGRKKAAWKNHTAHDGFSHYLPFPAGSSAQPSAKCASALAETTKQVSLRVQTPCSSSSDPERPKDRVSRNLKSVEKDNQLLAAREWHTAFNRGNIICCQPCLFRKLFLRKTEPFSALLYSFSYSLVNHSAYLHLFYNAHDNYMD